ncbi:MAG: type II toxin-antitoxin system RelE/ParE family toxin [Methanoregula sp.]|nr:type II toxin-antitoxin system RelE/ParE family toxin [Methanoregula sp.]
MVDVSYHPHFERTIRKISNARLKEHVKQQIKKIINNPSIGKPMRYCRKQTREVYIPPFRLSYLFDDRKDTLVFLAPCHKDEQ